MGGATLGGVEDDVNLEPPPDVDMTSYLLAVVIASLFGSFADTTLSKTSELSDTLPIGEQSKPKVKWKAILDNRTCDELPDHSPGCGSRNGTIYETDDPDLLEHMPGSGTHNYCRCYLETVISL